MIAYPPLGHWGRLGNQLWEIAGTAGIAYAEHEEPAFPNDWKYRAVFSIPDEFFHPHSDLRSMTDVGHSPRLAHIDPRDRYYMQDMSLWVDIEETIRAWFAVSVQASLMMSDMYPWMMELPRPVCGVHVRRGDYVTLPQHFPAPPSEYYLDGIGFSQSVVVFSDDIDWCRKNMAFPSYVKFFDGGKPMPTQPEYDRTMPTDWHDFLALMSCDSFVLSNSTFGWWAAYLSGSDDVMYPTPWYGEAIPHVDSSLMFTHLPKWVQCAY